VALSSPAIAGETIRVTIEKLKFDPPQISAHVGDTIKWMDKLPENLRDRLGIAIAESTYAAYRDLLDSERWQRLENLGARAQRLLFASTGTKDPRASDTLYIGALAAPNTVNTIPEETLLHFADHGEVGGVLPRDGGRANETLSAIVKAGVDLDALAAALRSEGANSFDES
jgi:transaldolase